MVASRRGKSDAEMITTSPPKSPLREKSNRRDSSTGGKFSRSAIRAQHKSSCSRQNRSMKCHTKALQDAITTDLQLKISKYKRMSKKLEERLLNVKKEKESELKAIRDETRKMKQDTKRIAKEQEEHSLLQEEAAKLKQDNKELRDKQYKMDLNCRNLRINIMRLEKAVSENCDYTAKLKLHHDRTEKNSVRLEKLEADARDEVEEAQEQYDRVTIKAHAEHQKKLAYRDAIHKTIEAVEELGDGALVLKLLEFAQQVEQYEATAEVCPPFGLPSFVGEETTTKTCLGTFGLEEKESAVDKFRKKVSLRRSSLGPGVVQLHIPSNDDSLVMEDILPSSSSKEGNSNSTKRGRRSSVGGVASLEYQKKSLPPKEKKLPSSPKKSRVPSSKSKTVESSSKSKTTESSSKLKTPESSSKSKTEYSSKSKTEASSKSKTEASFISKTEASRSKFDSGSKLKPSDTSKLKSSSSKSNSKDLKINPKSSSKPAKSKSVISTTTSTNSKTTAKSSVPDSDDDDTANTDSSESAE